jgi:hypothetical protein
MLNLRLSDKEQFLVECIKHRDHLNLELLRALYDQLGDAEAFAVCKHNRIVSLATDALTCAGIKLSERWLVEFVEMAERISEYMSELDKAAALLANHGIPMLALKNSGIARALYPYHGASPMGDIDVLVRKQDFRRAHEHLVSQGYLMKFRSPLEEENLELAEQGGGAEYSVQLPSGKHLWFELQWRPVAGRWIRPDQEPDATMLVERSIAIPSSRARLLSPEDNLLQVSLHTAKHSYVRAPGFRLHTDVDRIVRACPIDWELFCSQVEQLQVKTAVYLSLAFARELLATPIPEVILSRLSPAQWKIRIMSTWLQRVGLFDPDGPKWGRLGYIVFVSLLYDDFGGFVAGLFPSQVMVAERYGIHSRAGLMLFYVKRLVGMVFRRTLVRKDNTKNK